VLGRVGLLVAAAAVLATAIQTRASVVLLALCLSYVVMGPVDWVLHYGTRRVRRRRGLPPREEEI
jgi:predicted PurR-regulated permease PerM